MTSAADILHGNLLIVDDEEASVLLLERILRGAGYVSVTSIMDPGEVCALHRENCYDLILLDLLMPGIDGFEVMEGLKEIEPDGYLPVPVITALPGHKLRALQTGAKDFIGKPFEIPEVLARVHNMLEVRLLHRELHNYNDVLEEQVQGRTAELGESVAELASANEALRGEISARQAAEEKERKTRRQLALVYESSADVLYLLAVEAQEQFRFVTVNPAFLAVTGLQAEQVVGKRIEEVLPPAAQALVRPKYAEAIRENKTVRWEEVSEYPAGTLYGEVAVSPVYDESGACAHLVGTVHDVTERKQAETALRESEGFLRGLFDNMPSGAAIYEVRGDGSRGSDYIIKDFNAASLRIEGKTMKEVVGKSLFDLRPAIDEYGLIPALQRVWQTGEPALFPTTLYSDEHYTNWYENHVFRLPSGEVVAVYDDVTERKQAEQALQESEARYRGYVDTAPYGVFVSDEQGRYLEVNKAAAELTGYAQEELVQLSIADLVATESRDWGRRHFARLLRTGHASGNGVFLRKDGTSFPARVDAVRLAATRYLGFIVDISEQQRAAAEIEASAAQLKQALTATVAALSATTELRDPYTAGHQRRVAELAGAIAAGLGWDAARIEMVTTAGLLHDVGKIIVPAEILARPGRLNEMEMQIIRQHAAASAALIAGIEFGGPVAAIVNQHHERLDGSGYPQGLTGENILPEARILAVADVVEAMSSHRPYRAALGMDVALAEVREHAGVKYDADVVTVCGRLVEEQGFQLTP